MDPKYSKIKEMVYHTSISLYNSGLIKASSGNVSARIENEDLMAITPTGIRYDVLKIEDIVISDWEGSVVEGAKKPSSEFRMHAAIYKTLPNINGIVHTHSPFAITFAALGESLPMVSIEGLMVGSNILPVTEKFSIPGSQDVGDSALAFLKQNPELRGVLLLNHGLLTVGDELIDAMNLAESIELEAQIYYHARLLGTPRLISEEQRKTIINNYMKGKLT